MALRITASRPVYVLGGSVTKFIGKGHPDFIHPKHPEFKTRTNPTLKDYIRLAVGDALTATGTPAEAVDQLWIGNFCGELFSNQGHLGSAFGAAHPALIGKMGVRTEGACASGGLAFVGAVQGILAGADIAIASGVEVQTTVSARQGGDYLARAADYDRQRKIDDFTFPALFARRVQAYLARYPGVKHEDIAAVAAKAYKAGNANPKAHMHSVKLSQQEIVNTPTFLGNAEIKPFLRTGECSQVSDGGAAVVVVSEEGLRKIGASKENAIVIRGLATGFGDLWSDQDLWRLQNMAKVAQTVYGAAGWSPKDVDVAEVHDCFAIAEVMSMEAVQLAEAGKGAQFAREAGPDGAVAVNSGGGLVSFGHPVGATGIKQVYEIWSQLLGKCPYQKRERRRGITCNMGGEDKTTVFGAYERAL